MRIRLSKINATNLTADPASLFVAPYLRPRSVFGSFGVVLMSCKVNFHIVRSALQNSLSTQYIFAGQVFYRCYVLQHIRLLSFAV